MKKITMMDNLTLYINKREYKIEIDEKFTRVASFEDIEDLEHSLPGFFDVESIGRQNNKIYLVYDIPEEYEPIEKAKKYVSVIKLQLIKNFLSIDPLLESEGMTYLDFNNIFFKSFKDIKILYRSNGYLPYHKDISTIDQYKLFILGLYSNKYSYKRFLINKDILLRKENDDFMYAVNAATSISDLRALIDDKLEEEQTKFYEKAQLQETSRKRGIKRKMLFGIIGVLLLLFAFVGGMKQIEKKVANEFKQELIDAEAENDLILAVSSGDTDQAVKLMEDKGESSLEIAKMLLKAGKFDEAIAYDQDIEHDVVKHLYKINQKEKILDLKSESTFLTYEKEILEFDIDNLIAQAPLIEDKGTLKRLALSFIEHDSYDPAKDVLERMRNDNSEVYNFTKEELKEIDGYIKKVDLEIEVKNLNDQIANLKQEENSLEPNEEDKLKKEEEIKVLEDKLVEVQKKIIKLDEEIGMDTR